MRHKVYERRVFQSRPMFPKYTEIWDINIVSSYLKSLSPVEKLSLEDLTYKVTILLTLNLSDMIVTKSQFTFKGSSKVKQRNQEGI